MWNWNYKDMPSILQNKKQGNAAIEHFTVWEHDFRAIYIDGLEANKEYVRLMIDGEIMMSDAPMEKGTNYEAVEEAHGDVLIAGLGIGLILLPMQEQKEVKTITVIEQNQNVIDIVESQLPLNDKVRIIHADIFDYNPTQKFDCVYLDIWPDICKDNADSMEKLIEKFRQHLTDTPYSWCRAWQEDYVLGDEPEMEDEFCYD